MIIAVDFDGTIVRSNFPEIKGEVPYAGEVLRRLHKNGHYIIIWTCRCGVNLLDAINWLVEHDVPFSKVNDHNPENLQKYGEGGKKVFAHCYIDDRNVGGFPGWLEIERLVNEMDL